MASSSMFPTEPRRITTRFSDWWRGDVRVRLYGGVLCVVVLVTSLYSAYSVWVLREEALANANSRADQVAAVLVQSIARPLFDINTVAVTSVVSAIGASDRSPSVETMTNSASCPAAIKASRTTPACVVASRLPLVPIRIT